VDRLVPFRESSEIPPNPVERKTRHIFCLVPRQIPMEESSGAHFSDIRSATLGEDTFEVPKRSSIQIWGNPFDPFHSRGDQFETHIS
jgi:hypothetical protein